jgi:hypothetical protein
MFKKCIIALLCVASLQASDEASTTSTTQNPGQEDVPSAPPKTDDRINSIRGTIEDLVHATELMKSPYHDEIKTEMITVYARARVVLYGLMALIKIGKLADYGVSAQEVGALYYAYAQFRKQFETVYGSEAIPSQDHDTPETETIDIA